MDKIASLADKGKKSIVKENWEELGRIMNENTSLRQEKSQHNVKDLIVMKKAMQNGALGVKTTGSGGCIIILATSSEPFEALAKEYTCFKPNIVFPHKTL